MPQPNDYRGHFVESRDNGFKVTGFVGRFDSVLEAHKFIDKFESSPEIYIELRREPVVENSVLSVREIDGAYYDGNSGKFYKVDDYFVFAGKDSREEVLSLLQLRGTFDPLRIYHPSKEGHQTPIKT